MSTIRFQALPTEVVEAYRRGDVDANGRMPERVICPEEGAPCRHCLQDIAVGEPMLILAHRPFSSSQAYAECGPIFLHAEACARHPDDAAVPAMFLKRESMLIRGYNRHERIVYGTGNIVATDQLAEAAAALLDRKDVAFVHLRSAKYNCYQCVVTRA